MKDGDAPLITLTTDFGLKDGYVGVIKGVILSISPNAQIVDLSHEVESWQVSQADWIIANSIDYFPPKSIHVAIVDPTVGSERHPLCLIGKDKVFIGPDNGIFSRIVRSGRIERAFVLTNTKLWLEEISTTFHARDIFCPVAAHIANGARPERAGCEVALSNLQLLPEPYFHQGKDEVEGEVVYIDRFGNLITNIPSGLMRELPICHLESRRIGALPSTTYASVGAGQITVIAGSHGCIEIAARQGRADQLLAVNLGSRVKMGRVP